MPWLRTILRFLLREWYWWVIPLVLAVLLVTAFLLFSDHQAHQPFVYTH